MPEVLVKGTSRKQGKRTLYDIVCVGCGSTFTVDVRDKGRIYCTTSCYHLSRKGEKRPPFSESWRYAMSRAATGKKKPNLSVALKNSPAARELWFKSGKDNPGYGKNQTGPNNPNWKGGLSKRTQALRNERAMELKQWRTKVFERDHYTCQDCGTGGNLHAHHIIFVSQDPTKMLDLGNGITLCIPCHEKRHGRPINTTQLQAQKEK